MDFCFYVCYNIFITVNKLQTSKDGRTWKSTVENGQNSAQKDNNKSLSLYCHEI